LSLSNVIRDQKKLYWFRNFCGALLGLRPSNLASPKLALARAEGSAENDQRVATPMRCKLEEK